ncbi:unnamed protein product [Peronospora effusa]|nr:unnamed protein product [Peronospora effusa]
MDVLVVLEVADSELQMVCVRQTKETKMLLSYGGLMTKLLIVWISLGGHLHFTCSSKYCIDDVLANTPEIVVYVSQADARVCSQQLYTVHLAFCVEVMDPPESL